MVEFCIFFSKLGIDPQLLSLFFFCKGNKMRSATVLCCPFEGGIRAMMVLRRGIAGAAEGARTVFQLFEQSRPPLPPDRLEKQILPLEKYNLPLSKETFGSEKLLQQQLAATRRAHRIMEEKAIDIAQQQRLMVGIGGDHSITYPLAKGVAKGWGNAPFGLIYLDAHFDLRPIETYGPKNIQVISSGNSFRRLLEEPSSPFCGARLAAIGISPSPSPIFTQMYKYARQKGMTIYLHSDVQDSSSLAETVLSQIEPSSRYIYLSVDIDCLDESFAPGVSSPANPGLHPQQLLALVKHFARHPKVVAMDVVETSARTLAWFEWQNEGRSLEPEQVRQKALLQTAKASLEVLETFLREKIGEEILGP